MCGEISHAQREVRENPAIISKDYLSLLFVSTKLNNVAGISNSASQKALDLFLKVRYLDEKTGNRGFIGATGTPLSNSITELHTMMRYLEYDFLRDHGLQHFDNWVSVFGEQKTDWELAPAGNKFKERTRIANYTGLPILKPYELKILSA